MSAAVSAASPTTFGVRTLLRTDDDRVTFGLRLVLSVVMFAHGAQHTFGWFGGFGFAASRDFMANATGMPTVIAALACVLELLSPIALALGLFGRLAAGWIFAMMLFAASTHAANGFFMNWIGKQAGEGLEYHLLLLSIAAALIVRGSGAFSLDRRLSST